MSVRFILSYRTVSLFFAAALLAGAGGCATLVNQLLPKPKVSVDSVELEKVRWNGATLRLNLKVENPSSLTYSMDSFVYSLDVEGETLVRGSRKEKTVLPPGQTLLLPLLLEVKYADLNRGLRAVLKKERVSYAFQGTMTLLSGPIPLDLQVGKRGEIPIPRSPVDVLRHL